MPPALLALLALLAACGRIGFSSGCDDCTWDVTPFTLCSESCTSGVQVRAVTCHDASGDIEDDAACTDEKPEATRACAETGCAWTDEAFSACDVNCDGGTSTRIVECRTDSGLVAPDSYCVEPRPADSMACNTTACCTDFGNTQLELLPRGPVICTGSPTRYMVNPDVASMTERCIELGYDGYGGTNVPFTFMQWCFFCNARTKVWDGTMWVENGCNVGVTSVRCCNLP